MSYSPTSPPGGNNGQSYHFKILVPAVAAGAIIGKGGETIAQLQKDTNARVKMSKANDFYPGTTERVCLISGSVDGVLRIHEFIMEKIKEKPDPNAKIAIDFDHKQPAEREKQVKILVPNSTAGMIIGKGGSFIKQIKEESGAYVQISQKSRDHALAERCITVIGEIENNKKACAMIISKIVEDPQSGSCLNVSYADVTGPVANFNPTGSPYANAGNSSGGNSAVTNSNPSYSSNGSLNSLSPTLTNSFNSPQNTGTPGGVMQFSSVGLSPAVSSGNPAQMIESLRAMLRSCGYTEEAVSEICSAMNTLANYGMLGLGLGLGGMFNSVNGAPMISGLSMGMPGTPTNNCGIQMGSVNPGQNATLYTSQATGVPGLDQTQCNNVNVTQTPTGTGGNGLFGPVGSVGSGMSGMGMSHGGFGSPTGTRQDRLQMPDGSVFDPFRRSSPSLGSPGTGASSGPPPLPINNNSFGLGTGLHSPGSMRKSPTPADQSEGTAKIEVEIGDNIVGAILGHGGKSLVEIQRLSGANIQISKKGIFVPGTRNRIVTITGTPNAVQTAQYLIEQQIAEEENKRARQNATLGTVLR
jgi:RNA-binding protein Nova